MPRRVFTIAVDEYFVIIPVDKVPDANAFMELYDWDDGTDAFKHSAHLSADGLGPATHRGGNVVVDQEFADDFGNFKIQPQVSTWLNIFKKSDGYTWETACSAVGVQVITDESYYIT
jgi:hypothetical protein